MGIVPGGEASVVFGKVPVSLRSYHHVRWIRGGTPSVASACKSLLVSSGFSLSFQLQDARS